MRYRVMKLICMFDLPVETDENKRHYREFRKGLIKEGFIMMQYSVYIRTCPNKDFANRIEKRISRILPANGNVRLLCVTEKQYDDMKVLVGKKSKTEEMSGKERLIVI